MIERYTLPEMGRVWSEAHKYELWCRVEVLVLQAQARAGSVPAETSSPPAPAAVPACSTYASSAAPAPARSVKKILSPLTGASG